MDFANYLEAFAALTVNSQVRNFSTYYMRVAEETEWAPVKVRPGASRNVIIACVFKKPGVGSVVLMPTAEPAVVVLVADEGRPVRCYHSNVNSLVVTRLVSQVHLHITSAIPSLRAVVGHQPCSTALRSDTDNKSTAFVVVFQILIADLTCRLTPTSYQELTQHCLDRCDDWLRQMAAEAACGELYCSQALFVPPCFRIGAVCMPSVETKPQ